MYVASVWYKCCICFTYVVQEYVPNILAVLVICCRQVFSCCKCFISSFKRIVLDATTRVCGTHPQAGVQAHGIGVGSRRRCRWRPRARFGEGAWRRRCGCPNALASERRKASISEVQTFWIFPFTRVHARMHANPVLVRSRHSRDCILCGCRVFFF
jgi:hypothetical protein